MSQAATAKMAAVPGNVSEKCWAVARLLREESGQRMGCVMFLCLPPSLTTTYG